MLQQEGKRAPSLEKIRNDHWDTILNLPSKSSRHKFYQFLWKNEMIKEGEKEKKEVRKFHNEQRLKAEREEKANNNHVVYGLRNTSMFLRVYDSTVTHYDNLRLIRAMQFDQKIVIDCSYDEFMSRPEASNTGKQLMLSFAENRLHNEPFDLHFCNVNLNSVATKALHKYIPTMLDDDFPMNIHQSSMTEKFDKERLVYLTPHCRNDLEEYNHDDIYIIGAMVDKMNNEPLSLAKAKSQGLRMARLPLDRYLEWGAGSGKSLTINQMISIMLEMKKHGDWRKALRVVPRRKLADHNRQFEEPQSHQRVQQRPRQNFDGPREDFSRPPQQRYRDSQRDFSRSRFKNDLFDKENFRPGRESDTRDDLPQIRKFAFDERRSTKERKHADRFKFNLNTWGSKRADDK